MGLALAESARSTYNRVKIGAVVVRGNLLVSQGANLSTSHPLQFKYNNRVKRVAEAHNCHAEMHALIRAKGYESLRGCEMFVGRYDRRGRLAMCKPCPACADALQDHGIVRVTYTTPSGTIQEDI